MQKIGELSVSLVKMLTEKTLIDSLLAVIPAEQQYVFKAWMDETDKLVIASEKIQHVIFVKRGTTRKGDPMWKCATRENTEFYIFHPFALFGWVLYPEFMAMADGDTLYWDDCPIRIKLTPDGKYLKPSWVEQRPEGALPNNRNHSFNVAFVTWMFARPFATIDFETTGTHPEAEIVEIGIVFSDGRPPIHRLVKPQNPIPPQMTDIHSISDADVAICEPFWDVWAEVYPQIKDVALTAWNAEFEEARLQYELTRIGNSTFPMPEIMCAMKAYSFGRDYQKMTTALKEMEVPMEGRLHSGINDAEALLALLVALKKRVEGIDTHHRVLRGESAVPNHTQSPVRMEKSDE